MKHRSWLRVALGVALIWLVFASALVVRYGPRPFDRTAWHTTPLHAAPISRLRMARWLVFFRTLDGMTREEAIALLGPPIPAETYRDLPFAFELGGESDGFMGMVFSYLVLQVGPDGRVLGANIVQYRD